MTLTRRRLLAALSAMGLLAPVRVHAQAGLGEALDQAAGLPQLNSVIVARRGEVLAERVFDGPGLDVPVNIKSASKSVLSALLGIAIERGVVSGVDATLASILGDRVPPGADERVAEITLGHLVGMRAGLERTSGRNYGAWVVSDDWTAYALTRHFVAEPGGRMIYSTGSSHLLSAALTAASGRSTLDLARDWLGGPLGIQVPPWTRDPQGVFMGGNEMALSPNALLRLGECYRMGGVWDGQQVIPASWVEESWQPRVTSPWSGNAYGYGWWIGRAAGRRVNFAWGYGGQMVYVVPGAEMTVVMTSDPNARGVTGHVQALHRLLSRRLIPAALA